MASLTVAFALLIAPNFSPPAPPRPGVLPGEVPTDVTDSPKPKGNPG